MQLWKKLVFSNNHCMSDPLPKKENADTSQEGHNFILPAVKTQRFKRCFINRCLFNFVYNSFLTFYICKLTRLFVAIYFNKDHIFKKC